MSKKLISLDEDTKARLEILAALDGRKLKPFIEMKLKEVSKQANNLIGNWQNQSEITENTFKTQPK
jgi:hypothetical protein